MLYPISTTSRFVTSLDGLWDFKLLTKGEADSFNPALPLTDSIPMPVPAAYNDIYHGRSFREHVGQMAYQRKFTLQEMLLKNRLVLRFGSVTHKAWVYLNGELICTHKGGFLPFETAIENMAEVGENLLTVAVDNIVDYTTLPTGRLVTEEYPGLPLQRKNLPNFDFFNYAGIMRPVVLYTTPLTYIQDIVVTAEASGKFAFQVTTNENTSGNVEIFDPNGFSVFQSKELCGEERLESPMLWSCDQPSLYELRATLSSGDSYTEPFGFRSISIKNNHLLLNGEPIYLKGFGKHEDFAVIGRGFNEALNVKDIGLMKWMGANSFRTSHYPYSEEMMRLCDKEGILVIDEVPAVGLHAGFTATGMLGGAPDGTWAIMKTAPHHADTIRELIARDKNHPCVIMWSVANEPASEEAGAYEYFEPLCSLCKKTDPQKRPVTIVTYEGSDPESCKVAELCDVLVLNRYFGWYNYSGDLPAGTAVLKAQLEGFHKRVPNAPIMLGEYGADTIAGFHDMSEALFSEEFEVAFLKAYHEVLDSLPYITGEHVWNFADFATAENVRRVGGNKKGVFTRDRSPKAAAFYLKTRWTK